MGASCSRKPPGLSPRVRGNPLRLPIGYTYPRSIPACAGEPPRPFRPSQTARVYPRVCGGTRNGRIWGRCAGGLSPRVRGNRRQYLGARRDLGSIPACAGEPPICTSSPGQSRVYPRVCGGTLAALRRQPDDCGLSPRVRGNQKWTDLGAPRWGSIPACAGEPAPGPVLDPFCGVYPRVCGGTVP